MSSVNDLIERVEKVATRVGAVEKTITDMGRAQGDAADTIRKALTGGNPNGPAKMLVTGHDGDTHSLISLASRGRQKSIGMGSFLRDVAYMGNPQAFNISNLGIVEKSLERSGSKPINKTALAEGSGATGGYTVPPQFYAELLREIAEDAFVRSLCFTLPMTAKTALIPALDQSGTPATGTSSFFGGLSASWNPETVLSESEPLFRQIELNARELNFYTIISNTLLADNAVALDTILTSLFKESMAWFIDYYILRGNGAGQPLGVINSGAAFVESRSVPGRFMLDDAAQMRSHLLRNSHKKAVWVVHPSVMPELIQQTNGAAASPFLTWLNPAPSSGEGGPASQALPVQLLGIPIYESEKVPILGTKGDVMLCDFSKYVVGDRMALQISTSQDARFLQNQLVFRIIARFDGQPWLNAPIKMADGAFQMSPFVVLNT